MKIANLLLIASLVGCGALKSKKPTDGEPGATGPTGATGPSGAAGTDGAKGATGSSGLSIASIWTYAYTGNDIATDGFDVAYGVGPTPSAVGSAKVTVYSDGSSSVGTELYMNGPGTGTCDTNFKSSSSDQTYLCWVGSGDQIRVVINASALTPVLKIAAGAFGGPFTSSNWTVPLTKN